MVLRPGPIHGPSTLVEILRVGAKCLSFSSESSSAHGSGRGPSRPSQSTPRRPGDDVTLRRPVVSTTAGVVGCTPPRDRCHEGHDPDSGGADSDSAPPSSGDSPELAKFNTHTDRADRSRDDGASQRTSGDRRTPTWGRTPPVGPSVSLVRETSVDFPPPSTRDAEGEEDTTSPTGTQGTDATEDKVSDSPRPPPRDPSLRGRYWSTQSPSTRPEVAPPNTRGWDDTRDRVRGPRGSRGQRSQHMLPFSWSSGARGGSSSL